MENEQTATVAFLRAEAAATQLAEELTLLAKETRHYDEAAKSLEEVGARVRALSDAVLATSERAALVVEAMQQVGAPELIDRVRTIEIMLVETRTLEEGLLAAVDKAESSAGERDARAARSIIVLAEKLTGLEERLQVAEKVAASKADVHTVVESLSGLTDGLGQRLLTVEASLEAAGDGIAELHRTSATSDALAEVMTCISDAEGSSQQQLVAVQGKLEAVVDGIAAQQRTGATKEALAELVTRVSDAEGVSQQAIKAVQAGLDVAGEGIAALQSTSATSDALGELKSSSDKNHRLAHVGLEGAVNRVSDVERLVKSQFEWLRAESSKSFRTLRWVLIVTVVGALLSSAALVVSVRNAL